MPITDDLPLTEEQVKAGTDSGEVIRARSGSTGAKSRPDEEAQTLTDEQYQEAQSWIAVHEEAPPVSLRRRKVRVTEPKASKEAEVKSTGMIGVGPRTDKPVKIIDPPPLPKNAPFQYPVLQSHPETIATDAVTGMAPLPKGNFEKNPGKFIVDFMVNRLKEGTKWGKQEVQRDLKAAYEAQEAQPLWLKMLSSGSFIIKNPKNHPGGEYQRVLAADFPLPVGGKPGMLAVPRQLKTTRGIVTKTAEDVGMNETQFGRFIKARIVKPNIEPDKFIADEVTKFKRLFDSIRKSGSKVSPKLPDYDDEKLFTLARPASKNPIKWTKADLKAVEKVLREVEWKKKALDIVRKAQAEEERVIAAVRQSVRNIPRLGWINLPSGEIVATNMLKPEVALQIKLTNRQVAGSQPLTKTQSATLATKSGLSKPQLKSLANAKMLIQLFPATTTKAQPVTKTEPKTKIETKIKTETKTETEPKTKTGTKIKTETKTETEPKTKTGTETKTEPKIKTETKTETEPKIKTETKTETEPKTKTVTPTNKKLPLSYNRQKDNKKRQDIKRAKGAIAWRQGQLHGKDRWDVITSPYTKDENFIIILGRKPAGAILAKGPGSAKKTAQLIYGSRLKTATLVNQPGIFSTLLEPTGTKKIKLTFEKDVEITKKVGSLGTRGRVFPLP